MSALGLFSTTPLKQEDLRISSYSIHYEIHGPENPVGRIVFVMGLMSSMGGWSAFVTHFSTKGYQVLVLDNRGYGLSTPGGFERYTTTGMAKDVVTVLDHIEWTDPKSVHLVGISMGGMISQHVALMIPDRLQTLTLLATCAQHRAPKENPYVSLQVAKPQATPDARIKNLMSLLFSDETWLDAYDPKYPDCRDNRERMYKVLEHRLRVVPKPSFKTLFGQGLAVKTHNVKPQDLQTIGKTIGRVLVLTGLKDMMIDSSCSLELAKHIGAKLVTLENRGHGLPLESEVEIIKELEVLFALNREDTLTSIQPDES
jgi:pimeloyl-ACP methyl ester carboxylesterase